MSFNICGRAYWPPSALHREVQILLREWCVKYNCRLERYTSFDGQFGVAIKRANDSRDHPLYNDRRGNAWCHHPISFDMATYSLALGIFYPQIQIEIIGLRDH